MKCVAHKLDALQQENFTLADATDQWLDIVATFPKDNFKNHYKRVLERAKICLEDPMFLSAHLLHHEYNGKGQTPEQVGQALAWIQTHGVEEGGLTKWLVQTAPFSRAAVS